MPAALMYVGNVLEFRLDADGSHGVMLGCPPQAIPAPGQYLLAHAPHDQDEGLAWALYPRQIAPDGFVAAPPHPPGWALGTRLHLRGPLGKGFNLAPIHRNLALVALGDTAARLMPVIHTLHTRVEIALFTHAPLPALPPAVEAHPLSALPEALPWADHLLLDLPHTRLPDIRKHLGVEPYGGLPCPAQALVHIPMPCGGLAECGVCAVPTRRQYKLACVEGPVFDLKEIMK